MFRPCSGPAVEVRVVLQLRVRRHREVRVAADEPGHFRRNRVQRLARGHARRFLLPRLPGRQVRVPPVGQLSLRGEAPLVRPAPDRPPPTRRSASPSRTASARRASTASRKWASASGGTKNGSSCSQPSAFFVASDLLGPERAAVRLRRARLVRRAVADGRPDDDESRAAGLGDRPRSGRCRLRRGRCCRRRRAAPASRTPRSASRRPR